MAISLYEASVSTYLQILGATSGVLDKGLEHARSHGVDPEELVETRLYADMHPLRFQVQQLARHSVGAIEAIKTGVFAAPTGERPHHDYAGLQALVRDARQTLTGVTAAEVDARQGTEVVFQVGDVRRVFTAEGFLLSFSLPNFYFHATTAYDILRMKGVPVGKRDFMGALRLKG